jgi:lysine biosynthesis protein LysW
MIDPLDPMMIEEKRRRKGARFMPSGSCPECDGKISLTPAKVGQLLTCPHCDVQLEVTNLDPLEFDWAYDWDWDEDEDEDEEEEDVEDEY